MIIRKFYEDEYIVFIVVCDGKRYPISFSQSYIENNCDIAIFKRMCIFSAYFALGCDESLGSLKFLTKYIIEMFYMEFGV